MPTRKKRKSIRRRRVGASSLNPKSPLVLGALALGGYLLSDKINTGIMKVLPAPAAPAAPAATSGFELSKIVPYAEAGLGAMLVLSRGKSLIKTGGGAFLFGVGLKQVLVSAGVISGYQSVPVIGRPRLAGYQAVPVLGSTRMPSQLSGGRMPTQLSGYRVNGGYKVDGASKVMGSINPAVAASCANGSGLMR